MFKSRTFSIFPFYEETGKSLFFSRSFASKDKKNTNLESFCRFQG